MSAEGEKSGRGKKRRKRRSQVQMAKKFARSRQHGSDIDAETYQYMVRVLELMRGGFPSVEERRLFVKNVYEETVGRELEYARNQVGSRVLDSLLGEASFEVIRRLVEAFSESLRPLASDRFASHVLQKILIVCADRGNPAAEKPAIADDRSAEPRAGYNDIVLKLSKYFINNTEEFVFDTYANHLLRTVLECLGGLIDHPDGKPGKKSSLARRERRPVVEEYRDLLVESCNRLHEWPRFPEFGKDELTSGFLQSMVHALKDVNAETATIVLDKIAERCLEPGAEEAGRLSSVFENESSVRLVEACLAVAQPESFSRLYEKLFRGNLKRLSLMRAGNFAVQRLLDHCSRKEEFEEIFEQLSTHLSEIIEKGHTGVLSSVANGCLRLRTKQGAFVNRLLKTFHCEAAEKQSRIVLCVSTVKTSEELERIAAGESRDSPGSLMIDLHGSLTVQAMLKFNKPIRIVNSLVEMSGEELSRLFSDPKGSRIADAFMESEYVGEKSREKLARKLNGWLDRLAKSTHGSRSLEKIWESSGKNQRLAIMEELASAGESLRASKSGSIISGKLNVPLFARSKKEWTESQGKEEKTRALFANVIGNVGKDGTKQ